MRLAKKVSSEGQNLSGFKNEPYFLSAILNPTYSDMNLGLQFWGGGETLDVPP